MTKMGTTLKVQLNYKQSFGRGGNFFEGSTKGFGCLGSGWSGKACVATERVWMLTKRAENFTGYCLSTA